MKTKFVLGFLLLHASILFAQTINEGQDRMVLQLSPFMMIDPTPRLRAGLEYTSGRWGYSLTCGVGNSFLNGFRLKKTKYDREYSLIEFRPEIKYFNYKISDHLVLYHAAEFIYVHTRAILEQDHYSPADGSDEVYYKEARFDRRKTGFHIKTGFKILAGDWLEIDYFVGIGGAARKIKYHDIINPVAEPQYFEEWVPLIYTNEGNQFVLNPTIGLELGFVLWKK